MDSLEAVFNGRIFRIPDYQRGYSWETGQLSDLWSDIELLDEGKDHYTGVLSVIAPDKKTPKTLNVVDGQQRLTTLVILIKSICDLFDDDEWIPAVDKQKRYYVEKYLHFKRGGGEIDEVVFGYEENNPSHVHFKTEILGLHDTKDDDKTLYTLNLTSAYKFFQEKLAETEKEIAGALLQKITEQLKFNCYEIQDDLNQFVAFETMNNRGKQLSDMELLKNRLIYLSTLLPDLPNSEGEKDELRRDINNAWKTVYEYLGKDPQKRLSDDDFLRDHWILNFQYERKTARAYRDELLSQHFTAKNIRNKNLSYREISKYVHDIQNTVKAYFYMLNPDDSSCRYSENVREWLSKLNRLGFHAWRPMVMSVLSKGWDDNIILDILKRAERFNFVAFNVQFRRTSYKNSELYRCAKEMHESKEQWGHKRVADRLDEIKMPSLTLKRRFVNSMHENDNGFYAWSGLHYFLYEYELKLQKDKRDTAKVHWNDVNQETIEHIFPQTPGRGTWSAFRSKKNKKLVHDLGNLLLMAHKKNIRLSNKSFVEKCNHETSGYKSGSYSAIEVASNKDWTPDSVCKRRDLLLNFMWERWNMEDKDPLEQNEVA